ncbi:hypothetical protein AB9K34_02535 [Sedimentitalea sp. XS_ASV28]|uniref:hypothetical protein n=1 Tax=Sedimentitalea sp. XS_ASV28 TaxID=3241296 RepID=UPI003518C5AD
MKRFISITCAAALLGGAATAHEFGFAGILSKSNKEDLPELTLSVGKPIADGPITLKSGTAYELEIEADGTGELALEGSGFFRAIWVNEVVVNGLEIRPFGIHSLEFDEAGTMEIEFVAIKPGRYELKQPGSTGESQRVEIIIE